VGGGGAAADRRRVDGDLLDFAADEETAGDATGDSVYGANNDLSKLWVTWDKTKLYLGASYVAWGTGVMVLLETGTSGGAATLALVLFGLALVDRRRS
jgi:hypothetical protein